jgi:hypothetical protein
MQTDKKVGTEAHTNNEMGGDRSTYEHYSLFINLVLKVKYI